MYLGFGIIFSENGSLKTINFDIISTDEKSDAMAAVRGFRILRSLHFFKQIDKKNYIIWSDCGKSFRNSTVCGYLFKELKSEGVHGKIFDIF